MDITEYQKEFFAPSEFMMIYTSNNQNKYIEIGPVYRTDDNKYTLGESRPVDVEFLSALVELVKTSEFNTLHFKGLTPRNVIYHHSENNKPKIIWYRPAEKRNLYFDEGVGIESGEYEMPITLFCLHDGDLSVYRVLTDEIQEQTELYKMPLPNIYQDAKVCLGYAKQKLKKPKSLEQVIALYEDLFYKTEFNYIHDQAIIPKGVVYIELVKNRNMIEWPLQQSRTKTIKDLLK